MKVLRDLQTQQMWETVSFLTFAGAKIGIIIQRANTTPWLSGRKDFLRLGGKKGHLDIFLSKNIQFLFLLDESQLLATIDNFNFYNISNF